MNPAEYEKYVREHAIWFRGHNPEKLEAVDRAEQRLGVAFPESLRWLLTQYGYWRATGVAGLPCIVGATLANRPAFPDNWILLGQPNSCSGEADLMLSRSTDKHFTSEMVILVLSSRHRWDGKAVFRCKLNGEIIARYSGFTEYTIARQRFVEKHSSRDHQNCLPSFHHSRGEPLVMQEDIFNKEEFQRRLLETILHREIKTRFANNNSDVAQLPCSIKPLTGSAASKRITAELIAGIIENRREYLYQNRQLIPLGYRDSSSSPRQNLKLEPTELKGHLLVAEFGASPTDSADHKSETLQSLLLARLREWGIEENQIVSLIREVDSSGERDWLICWISAVQFAEVKFKLKESEPRPRFRFIDAAQAESLVSHFSEVA